MMTAIRSMPWSSCRNRPSRDASWRHGRSGSCRMSDEKGRDDKILCVATGDPRNQDYFELKDMPKHMLDEISEFFKSYKRLEEGKGTTWRDGQARRSPWKRSRTRSTCSAKSSVTSEMAANPFRDLSSKEFEQRASWQDIPFSDPDHLLLYCS